MKKKMFYGMEKKISFLLMGILLLAFAVTSVAICILTRRMVKKSVTEKYSYMNEKAVLRLFNTYAESDKLTEQYIANEMVQKSLERTGLNRQETVSLKKQLTYVTFPELKFVLYVDNKNQAYGTITEKFNVPGFKDSGLYGELLQDYSVTRWMWENDITGQEEEKFLYICRMIHHMEYAHDPGIIIMSIDSGVFENVFRDSETEPGVTQIIVTDKGEICYLKSGKEEAAQRKLYQEMIPGLTQETGMQEFNGGYFLYQRENNTGFFIVTVLSDSVYRETLKSTFLIIFCIFLCIGVIAISVGFFFSRRLTEPVNKMNEVMEQFDGSSFHNLLHFNTNTELDSMSENYNQMLLKMEGMVNEIKNREREAYRLQLDSLMYQINPHFLYNIIDNIYMMARLNNDKRMMDILQALSNFLRIGLSKGKEEITVEKELLHVQSYLDIQKIRNQELFDYEISCPKELKKLNTLKLILQPLAENCIQHGFADLYEGGKVRICVEQQEDSILFLVWNNGAQIDKRTLLRLNALETELFEDMEADFGDKKGGFGVVNVIKRLRLYYGTAVSLRYVSNQEGIWCTVKIPVREDK